MNCKLKYDKKGLGAIIEFAAEHRFYDTVVDVTVDRELIVMDSDGVILKLFKPEAEKLLSWLQNTIPHMKNPS